MTPNKNQKTILLIVSLLLVVTLAAMQFTNEVNWSLFDFLVAGILLSGTAFLCEFVWRKVGKPKHRILLCLAVLMALVLIWAELAVGVFDTPFAGS